MCKKWAVFVQYWPEKKVISDGRPLGHCFMYYPSALARVDQVNESKHIELESAVDLLNYRLVNFTQKNN